MAPSAPAPPESPRTRVAVVDDNIIAGRMLADILIDEGYQVEVFRDPVAALRRAKERPFFDVMTVDMVMPEMSGLDLLRQLRAQDDGFHNMPDVVIVTSIDDVETAVRCIHAGAVDYLVKPVDAPGFRLSVARALERRQLLEENARLRRDVALWAAGQRLLETLDAHALAERGLATLCQFAKATGGVLLQGARVLAAKDVGAGALTVLTAQEGPRRCDGAGFWPDTLDSGRRVIDVPIDETRRALLLTAPLEPEPLSPARAEAIALLAGHLASAFTNVSRFANARLEAERDDVSGLYNQRAFRVRLERLLAEHLPDAGADEDTAVLFVDLDHFKRVNDDFGHLAGTALLAEVGQVLKRCVREGDIVARYGGDEFVVLLRHAPLDAACAVAERARASIAGRPFLSREGMNVRLTATFGVATARCHSAEPDTLLDLADRAMYLGKRGTRNVVHSAGDLSDADLNPAPGQAD